MDLLTAKLEHGFSHLDRDGDGMLTEHDHLLMGQSVAASLGYPRGSAQEQRIIGACLGIWRDLHLPHVPPGTTGISKEQFVTSTRTLAGDPALARATVGALAGAFADIADSNGDGVISSREYGLFIRGHFPRLTDADLAHAFTMLDTDGDGQLSRAELVTAIIEFWTSTDPAANGNRLAGPVPGPD